MRIKLFSLLLLIFALFFFQQQKAKERKEIQKNQDLADQSLPGETAITNQAIISAKTQTGIASARAPSAENSKPRSLTEWLTPHQSPSGLKLRLGPEGQLTLVTGLRYHSDWNGSADGLSFAQSFAEALGIPKEQVVVDPRGAPPATDRADVFRYAQFVESYPVFGSYVQLTQSKGTRDIYLIVNELKDLGTPDLTVDPSIRVEEILKNKYGAGIGLSLERNAKQIFSKAPKQSELAWAYSVEVLLPERDRRFVLVSTKSGQILFEQSLVLK